MSIPERLARIGSELVAIQAEIVQPAADPEHEKTVDALIQDAVLIGKVEAMRTILKEISKGIGQ